MLLLIPRLPVPVSHRPASDAGELKVGDPEYVAKVNWATSSCRHGRRAATDVRPVGGVVQLVPALVQVKVSARAGEDDPEKDCQCHDNEDVRPA